MAFAVCVVVASAVELHRLLISTLEKEEPFMFAMEDRTMHVARVMRVAAGFMLLAATGCAEEHVETQEAIADLLEAGDTSDDPIWNPTFWVSAYTDAGKWHTRGSLWGTIAYPDLNGDGKQDVCGRADNGIFCALSTGGSFGAPTFWSSGYSNAAGWHTTESHWGTIRFPDLNGDGKQDVCGRASPGIVCALSNGSSFGAPTLWTSGYSDAAGWHTTKSNWGTIAYPDLNSDGRHDICGRASNGMICALSNGSSFGAPSLWTGGYSDASAWHASPAYWGTIKFPDLNGDGRHDICGRGIHGMACALSSGSAFGTPSLWTSGYSDASGWTAQTHWDTIDFPDLNGDGRHDICGRGIHGMACALSSGSAFGIPSLWTSGYSDAGGWRISQAYWGTIEFPDVNGDGRHDVCGRGVDGMACALSTGGSFDIPSLWTTHYSDAHGWNTTQSHWGTIEFPDLDGDGRQDVCGRASAGILCAS